jgi:hypothetical protein
MLTVSTMEPDPVGLLLALTILLVYRRLRQR